MKKIKTIACLSGLFLSAISGFSQTPWSSQPWAVPPNTFNTNVDPPTNTAILNSTSSSYFSSNGAYDQYGNMLFYVKDLNVYTTASGTLPVFSLPEYPVGAQSGSTWGNAGHEIEIVKVPGSGNCNQFYVIYELTPTSNGGGGSFFAYVMIDCGSGTPVMTIPQNGTAGANTNAFGNSTTSGLAVSKLDGGIRHLFTINYQAGVQTYTIGPWSSTMTGQYGIYGPSDVATLCTLFPSMCGPGAHSNNDWKSICELELSPDQTRLAWTGNKNSATVYEITMTNYAYNTSSYTEYTVPNSNNNFAAYGLEYAQPTSTTNRLHMATGNGIYYFTPVSNTTPTITKISNSDIHYGFTQLELTGTGNILGVYTSGSVYALAPGQLFEITVGSANSSLALSANTSAVNSFSTINSVPQVIYHLPSQVDGDAAAVPVTLTATLSIPAAICQGNTIVGNGTYTGNTSPDHYYWEVVECDPAGNPTANGYTWSSWYPGAPSGPFSIPGSNTLACGKYYRIGFAVQNVSQCFNWSINYKIVYVNCPPTPVVSGELDICSGSSTTLCCNYAPSSLYTVIWGPGRSVNSQCLTVHPTVNTTYDVTVTNTSTGCSATVSIPVHVYSNNPEFTFSSTYTSPSNCFTVNATPVTPYNNTISGFGDMWIVEQIDPGTGATIPNTNTSHDHYGNVQDPNCWWIYPNTVSFEGFDGTKSTYIQDVTCGSPTTGKFLNGATYRITHGMWNDYCPWAQISHTVSTTGHRSAGDASDNDQSNVPDYSYLKNVGHATAVSASTNSSEMLTVFPNPSSGLLNIKIDNPTEEVYQVEVFDMYGKLLYRSADIVTDRAGMSAEIDIRSLRPTKGLYMVMVNSATKTLAKKVMIE